MTITHVPGDAVLKDPNSTEPIGFDWSAWLAELGPLAEIATSTFLITGPDAVLTQASDTKTTTTTQVFLLAGTAGGLYTLTNRITTNTAPPVTDDRSILIQVQDR